MYGRAATADLLERLGDRAAAEHVNAGPGEVVPAAQAGPQQRAVQGAAGERDVGSGPGEDPGLHRVVVGHLAGEEADVDARAKPHDLVG